MKTAFLEIYLFINSLTFNYILYSVLCPKKKKELVGVVGMVFQ